ncbi:hypothetical protein BjapCC829_49610 (plasmid) [Bradyrhizobium barranii]|uniref:Uncharacterized protein n=1 Tax=Bradyrhizobium barranii TaxID=2992140 RepID=A0ABY3R362_9BRAD|nr:hypothetical protein [Bradyrhizobium japonicum]UFW92011.1 hypothetical protein BjapCC829_49610 [Bradyrhizobium japonicum]
MWNQHPEPTGSRWATPTSSEIQQNPGHPLGRPTSYLTLPQTAIVYNTYGESVCLAVKSDAPGKQGLVARQTFIKTAPPAAIR